MTQVHCGIRGVEGDDGFEIVGVGGPEPGVVYNLGTVLDSESGEGDE